MISGESFFKTIISNCLSLLTSATANQQGENILESTIVLTVNVLSPLLYKISTHPLKMLSSNRWFKTNEIIMSGLLSWLISADIIDVNWELFG